MRKIIISSIIIGLLTFIKVNAQENDFRENPTLGLKVGINSSNLYDTEGDNFDHNSKSGLAFGAFLSIPFGKYLGFQPEVVYSQKGYKGSVSVLGVVDYGYTRSTDYIDIPLQLQLKPIPMLTILIGPQYSFLIHKGIKYNSGTLTVDQQNDIENNNIRKNILGVDGGIDLNIQRLVLSGRIAWDLQNNNGDGTSTSPRYRNVVMQLTVGVLLW